MSKWGIAATEPIGNDKIANENVISLGVCRFDTRSIDLKEYVGGQGLENAE